MVACVFIAPADLHVFKEVFARGPNEESITMLRTLLLVFFAQACLCCNSQDEWYSPLISDAYELFLASITHNDTATHMQNQLTSIQFFQWDANASVAFVPEGPTPSVECSAVSLGSTHCSIEITKVRFHLLKKVRYLFFVICFYFNLK